MSILSDKTEKKAMQVLASTLHYFERLSHLEMTKTDDWDTCAACSLIEGIIQSNGYRVGCCTNGRTKLIKDKG